MDQSERAKQGKGQLLPGWAEHTGKRGFLVQRDRREQEDQHHQDAERRQRDGAAAGELCGPEKVAGDGG